jgi:hypothetical protein
VTSVRTALLRLVAVVSDHPTVAPIGLGFLSGATAGPLLVGAVAAGWLVGRAGIGRSGSALSTGAFAVGMVTTFVRLVQGSLPRCPSCVDAYLVAPFVLPLFVAPFVIGMWIGRRTSRRLA